MNPVACFMFKLFLVIGVFLCLFKVIAAESEKTSRSNSTFGLVVSANFLVPLRELGGSHTVVAICGGPQSHHDITMEMANVRL